MKIDRYAKIGVFVFAIIAVLMFAVIYASQSDNSILLYSGSVLCLILSFVLLFFLLRSKNSYNDMEQELNNMRKREQVRFQDEQEKSERNAAEQTEKLDINDILAKVLPSENTVFENASLYSEKILQNIAKESDIVQGLIFVFNDEDQQFHISGEYAYYSEEQPRSFPVGETISGQVAKNKELLNLQDIPEGYITILSGLGQSSPRNLIIAPIIDGDACIGVLELASFKPVDKDHEDLIGKIAGSMAGKLNELRKKV